MGLLRVLFFPASPKSFKWSVLEIKYSSWLFDITEWIDEFLNSNPFVINVTMQIQLSML